MQVWWHRAEECPRRGWRARRRRAPAQGPAAPCGAGDGGDCGGDERRAGPVALMEERRGGGG